MDISPFLFPTSSSSPWILFRTFLLYYHHGFCVSLRLCHPFFWGCYCTVIIMTTEFPRYPLAVALPVLSAFSIAVSITPLILHAKNRNISTTTLIAWYIILNTFNIINSLVWPTDDLESAWDGTGLCDVEVKLIVGGYFAVPGTLVGIFRGLAIVLDTSRATLVPSRKQRWRNRIMDIVFCFMLPSLAMVLHIIWQKDRYLLYAISGCVVDLDESWASFVLCFIWPPVICLIAAFYCCRSSSNSLHC